MTFVSNQSGYSFLSPLSENGISFAWAFTLISALYEEGVRDILVSPGSRSTSLVLALEAHGGFRSRVILDERSAGFAALGIGKCAPFPAALICTSGTAALNYAPAIQEASSSGTPMVVITADRPPSLRMTGSSQTIDQLKLYGDRVVFFHECGIPTSDSKAFRRIHLAGKQAVQEALLQRGVSHLNVAFDKPFEPVGDQLKHAHQLASRHHAKKVDLIRRADFGTPSILQELLQHAKKPLIIAGPMNISDPIYEVGSSNYFGLNASERVSDSEIRIPILADPGSCFNSSSSGDIALLLSGSSAWGNEAKSEFTPDLIIRIGDTPFSPALNSLLEKWQDIQHVLITSRFTWQDPLSLDPIRWVTQSAPGIIEFLQALSVVADPKWIDGWHKTDREISECATSISLDGGLLTDLSAIEAFCDWLPPETPLFLSNSMIPRDVALIQSRLKARNFLVNRGAAGIDGITSSAVGVQLAMDQPVALLTGDLAFLHDVGALSLSDQLTAPLRIGVIQNGGGTIFRKLPVHETIERDSFIKYFETPQKVDLESLCKAYQVSYIRVTNRNELIHMSHPSKPGIYVYELITEADASHLQRKEFIKRAFDENP